MASSIEFNLNKFIKNSPECSDHSIGVVVDNSPTPKPVTTKKKTKKADTELPANSIPESGIQAPQTSLSYIQTDIPYATAYQETNDQLNTSIEQLNILGGEMMNELMNIRSSKTLKNKYGYINDMTATITNIINTKIGAIKEKNKTINDINNLELRRVKDLKINNTEEDDNTKIMNLYDAFINTPIGIGPGGGRSILGPSMSDMTVTGGAPDLPRIPIGNDQQLWEQNLSPAENRMVLDAKGLIETVVFYDENSGNRWFEVVDKNTGQPIPNVEKPDNSYIYDLDINIRGGYAKDSNRNVTYRLVVVNGADQSILDY